MQSHHEGHPVCSQGLRYRGNHKHGRRMGNVGHLNEHARQESIIRTHHTNVQQDLVQGGGQELLERGHAQDKGGKQAVRTTSQRVCNVYRHRGTSSHLKCFLEPAVPPIRLCLMINMMPLKRCVVKGNYFTALLRNEARNKFLMSGP